MRRVLPEITTYQSLSNGRMWTATCESVDPRLDDAYYLIELWADDQRVDCIMVKLYARLPSDVLHDQLHKFAESGVSNTEYRGSHLWRRHREAQGLPTP